MAQQYIVMLKLLIVLILKLIGILYLRAVFRLNIFDREVILNQQSAHDIIGATISLHKFKFNCGLMTFGNKGTRNDRWKTDKLA